MIRMVIMRYYSISVWYVDTSEIDSSTELGTNVFFLERDKPFLSNL
jgi:hypothetical protein